MSIVSIRDELLKTIIDHPDDDASRLVFADWLDEHGEPERAEFIRVQCELANNPHCAINPAGSPTFCNDGIGRPFPCKPCKMRRREKELLFHGWFPLWDTLWAGNETHWRGLESPAEFRRGFVEVITCTWADWLTHHKAILAATTLKEVFLTTVPGRDWILLSMWNDDGSEFGRIGVIGEKTLLRLLNKEWPGITFDLPPCDAPADLSRVVRDGFTLRLG